MIETDATGQKQIEELIKNRISGEFNEWEQGFIRELSGRKYSNLSTREKAVVTRLIGWLHGGSSDSSNFS